MEKLFFTENDSAKYPFIPRAARHVQSLNVRITHLDTPEYIRIVDRAEERIQEAIDKKLVSFHEGNDEIEILSFPIAVMMVVCANNSYLKKRYALAEAKRVATLLRKDNEKKIVSIAKLFNWKIKSITIYESTIQASVTRFAVDFISYLRNTSIFHESKWKLVNRTMKHGEVYLGKNEVARLLAEEVRAYIEIKLDQKVDVALSKAIIERVKKLKQLCTELQGKKQQEEMPKEMIIDAFPPCIKLLYEAALTKKHLSHIERFTLTSFLLNSGMTVENVIEFFRPTSDFSEKMTRYQVEHIAGGRGSRTKYVPPKCDTLRTHGVCPSGDEICEKIWSTIAYYRKKSKIMKSKTSS